MLNESVINVLKNGMWDLATCADGEPNVVPVAFKDVTDDGRLVVGDVFLETTLNNIKANGGKIAISAYDARVQIIKRKFNKKHTNKFHSNFKKYYLQAIIVLNKA